MKTLSAAIITYNEEHNIERCVQSLKGICDEIVVVDSYSNDKTQELCHKYGVRFVKNAFKGHIEQKNFALSLCNTDYVLSLDADEALSAELQTNILNEKIKGFSHEIYKFHRLNFYINQPIHHCGWYPDTKIRLVKKNHAIWGGKNPHDELMATNKSSVAHELQGDLYHYSYNSISDHVQQTNRFTTIAAKTLFEQGVRSNFFKIFTRPFWQFFRDYFLKFGFLDGRYGFIICFINALSALLKYSKLKELQDS